MDKGSSKPQVALLLGIAACVGIQASAGLMPRGADGLRQVPAMSIFNEDTPNMIGPHPTAGGVVPDHAPVTATFV